MNKRSFFTPRRFGKRPHLIPPGRGAGRQLSQWWRPRHLALLLVTCSLAWGPGLWGQTLWRDDLSRSMFADKRATAVGDLLSVIVQENTSSTKKNNTSTSKKSSIDSAVDTFFYSPGASGLMTKGGQMPAVKLAGNTSFSGGGQISNEERMTARFAVRVFDVLPNGSLLIEGKRQTKISGETTDAVLRGVVRQEDVTSANTVYSYQIADASIQYHSKGVVSDSQRKGWFLRLWDKVMPF
jgi:flagellar L-ring protein FlgH